MKERSSALTLTNIGVEASDECRPRRGRTIPSGGGTDRSGRVLSIADGADGADGGGEGGAGIVGAASPDVAAEGATGGDASAGGGGGGGNASLGGVTACA